MVGFIRRPDKAGSDVMRRHRSAGPGVSPQPDLRRGAWLGL